MNQSVNRPGEFGARLLGAELLASRELAEGAGSLWDALERGSRIQQQQMRWLVDDYARYIDEMISESSPWSVPAVTSRHVEQRLRHIGAGWKATGDLLKDELAPLFNAWKNFAAASSQDPNR